MKYSSIQSNFASEAATLIGFFHSTLRTSVVALGLTFTGSIHGAAPASPDMPPPPEVSSLPEGSMSKLGELPAEVKIVNLSADGRTIQMVGRKGSRHAVFVNGVADKVYDEILTSFGNDLPFEPRCTADGKISLFIARREKNFYMVANGQESAAFDKIVGAWLAPTGGGYVMFGMRSGKMVIHRDGVDLPSFIPDGEIQVAMHGIEGRTARYSPDGRRFVFLARLEDKKTKKERFRWVLDNMPLQAFSSVLPNSPTSGWVFGEGSHYAFVAGDIKTSRVIFDGKEGPAFGSVGEPQITADGAHVVYLAQRFLTKEELDICVPKKEGETAEYYKRVRENGMGAVLRIIRDGKEMPWVAEPLSQPQNLTLSPSGKVAVAYGSRWGDIDDRGRPRGLADGFKVWIDGESSMEYDAVYSTHFSPDGNLSVSFVSKEQRFYALINGEESDAYAKIDPTTLGFSADGKSYSFAAENLEGKQVMVGNGKASENRYDGLLVRSADGSKQAFVSARKQDSSSSLTFCNLVVGDKAYEIPGQVVSAKFNADGTRIACIFNPDPNLYKGVTSMAWVDGQLVPPLALQSEVSDLEFSPDGKHFAYTALVNDPENPKRGQASGYDVHVRVIDGRPGPKFEMDYQISDGSGLVRRMYPTTFEDDGSVSYFARHENAIHRIKFDSSALSALPDMKMLSSTAREKMARKSSQEADAKKADEAQKMAEEKQAATADPFQILHEFSRFEPKSGFVVDGPDGRLYGSEIGGRFDLGQLFSIKKDGSDYKVLRTYEGKGEKGLFVNSLFFGADGNLYGTTQRRLDFGKEEGAGTFFQYELASGGYNNLYVGTDSDSNETSDIIQDPVLIGVGPNGPHLGKLFAVASFNIVQFDVPSRTAEVVHNASPGAATVYQADGKLMKRWPTSMEAAAWREKNKDKENEVTFPIDGNLTRLGDQLYSVFKDEGRGNAGKIVAINLDGTGYAVVYDFAMKDAVGGSPDSWLVAGDDGLLYGATTEGGAAGEGAVYSLKPGDSECKLVVSLTKDCNNIECLAVSNGSVFVGDYNGVWKVVSSTEPPQQLKSVEQVHSLRVGSDGNLYGASSGGGEKFQGFVFSYRLNK